MYLETIHKQLYCKDGLREHYIYEIEYLINLFISIHQYL